MITIIATGDAESISFFGGSTALFLEALRGCGYKVRGVRFDLNNRALKLDRVLWNASQLLLGRKPGGYQYSKKFRSRYDEHLSDRKGIFINFFFQLFPESLLEQANHARLWFYIDQPLVNVFEYYNVRNQIGGRTAKRALAYEKMNYEAAQGIICTNQWAAESLCSYHDIPPEKVFVVPLGANLSAAAYDAWERRRDGPGTDDQAEGRPLRLVFVGKYWERKGLDRLIEGLRLARASGGKLSLRIIGLLRENAPERYRNLPGIEWIGYVDKENDQQRFLDLVSDCDIGCLLSRAEAGAHALREYHALGLAVVGPNTGGCPELVLKEASVLVEPDATHSAIGVLLGDLARDRGRVEAMKNFAWNHRRMMLWSNSAGRIAEIIGLSSRQAESSAAGRVAR